LAGQSKWTKHPKFVENVYSKYATNSVSGQQVRAIAQVMDKL